MKATRHCSRSQCCDVVFQHTQNVDKTHADGAREGGSLRQSTCLELSFEIEKHRLLCVKPRSPGVSAMLGDSGNVRRWRHLEEVGHYEPTIRGVSRCLLLPVSPLCFLSGSATCSCCHNK